PAKDPAAPPAAESPAAERPAAGDGLAAGDGPAAGEPPAEARARTSCPWCRESLPRRATVNYCPFCGADMNTAPCANCGEELEAGWRFCIACGTAVEDGG